MRAMKPTPARGVEAEVRGHGDRAGLPWPLKCVAATKARRSVAPHLPRAGFFTPTLVREIPQRETSYLFLQAAAGPCSSSRHAWAGGRARRAWPVEDKAGRGGAHGRARVRVRAGPRARQRVRRRLSASRHGVALFKRLYISLNRGWNHKGKTKAQHRRGRFFILCWSNLGLGPSSGTS